MTAVPRRACRLRSAPALIPWLLALCAGCATAPVIEPATAVATVEAPAATAVAATSLRQLADREDGARLVGRLQRIRAHHEDTLPEIARRYGLGFAEIRRANPGVDTWLPGEGTPVLLPTALILPERRHGLVLNLASRRLYHFDPQGRLLSTAPMGIGREGWATPTGEARVVSKARDPVWYVPASIRAEHAEAGDPLPARVGPGPDNPLGAFAMALDMPGYLIHGTNKPYGVGMRVSHGCVRLYPEDIESLFPRVPLGTPVSIINEPVLVAEVDGVLYLEVHEPVAAYPDWGDDWSRVQGRLLQDEQLASRPVDWDRVRQVFDQAMGIPVPVSPASPVPEQLLAAVTWADHPQPEAVEGNSSRP